MSFCTAWAAGAAMKKPSVAALDAVSRSERMADGRKRVHAVPGPLRGLSDAAVVVAVGAAYTFVAGQAFCWTEEGYVPSRAIHHADGLLTPPSTLMVLRAGYRPVLHPTIEAGLSDDHRRERPI